MDVLAHVFGLTNAAAVWHALNEMYSSQSKSRVSTIRGALTNTKKTQYDGATVNHKDERICF
jgi:hypothetical protein